MGKFLLARSVVLLQKSNPNLRLNEKNRTPFIWSMSRNDRFLSLHATTVTDALCFVNHKKMNALSPYYPSFFLFFQYSPLFIVCTILCATVQTYITYTTIITTITIRLLFVSAYNRFCMPHLYVILLIRLFAILLTTFICKHYIYSLDLHDFDLQTHHNFTHGWLNYYWNSSALSCRFIVQHI